ncbi:MAG: type II toxin-antitoxin system RelE/ParE family toxin [Campylobacterales bacterium]|nr:type II toxin-antitoxin system RelE/ParE family toxin [Campylobacterales bacterium]
MAYALRVSKEFTKFFAKRTPKEQVAIESKLMLLCENPYHHPQLDISPYKGEADTYHLRYRTYRIIYRVVDAELIIFLLVAGNRGDVYK